MPPTFADNLGGVGRLPDKENQFGYQAGGPILRNRLFFSSALEQLISHSAQDPQTFVLPTTNFIRSTALEPARCPVLQEYPGPAISGPSHDDELLSKSAGGCGSTYRARTRRLLDQRRADHFMARLNIARLTEPDLSGPLIRPSSPVCIRTPPASRLTGCIPGRPGSPAN